MNLAFRLLLILPLVLSCGCGRSKPVKLPPVIDGWRRPSAIRSGYTVQKGDTLYSVAWAFGLDYRHLAKINRLTPPYKLFVGQRLLVAEQRYDNKKTVFLSSSPAPISKTPSINYEKTKIPPVTGWAWPTLGKVIAPFSYKPLGNKGIDISGSYSQAVQASNSGIVVYAGTGIPTYGKLIIIKHSDDYLSAYAYNQIILVDEGQIVKTGQKIATMGRNDAGHERLHFEIRRFGKPVNPISYLPKRS